MHSGNQIQEIKERLPIEEVVSRYVKLEKSGINLKGLCPFHNEKSPSFFVAPHRGSFMCFGCGKKGDIFTFIQEIESLEFFDALKQLAQQAGVELETSASQDQKPKKDAYAILEKACLVYESLLTKHVEAQEYLAMRGLTEKTIRQFRIGFVPDEWGILHGELKGMFDEKEILDSGLVIKSENGRLYDRFRGRIMFPIFDSTGKVIAFTGRILKSDDKESPKYVNSPETQLFSKSHVLYGLNFAKQAIRKHNFAILVEGQMDVIMSHQMGYGNTIASSGTAFTQDQLQMISRLTPNLLLAFDSDSAGLATTAKVWEMALSQGLDVKIAYYEGAKDPADTINENPDTWREIVKNSIHIIEFVARLVAKIPDERKRLKAYEEKVLPLLRRLHTYSEKNFFIEKVGSILTMNSSIIWSDLSLMKSEDKWQGKVYVQPDKIDYDMMLGAYICLYQKKQNDLPIRIEEFLKSLDVQSLLVTSADEKKLFEIENQFEENPTKVANDFKELFSQYTLIQLRLRSKQLREELRTGSMQELEILKKLEENKKIMHEIQTGVCQFINDMV